MVSVVGAEQVDVEAHVIAYLRPLLPGATVATSIPRSKTGELAFPARMVRVSRTGGVRWSPAHDRPTVLVECWAGKSTDAWRLCADARAALLALDNTLVQAGDPAAPAGAWLSHVAEGSGPVNFEDPDNRRPRYQFLHEFLVRRAHTPQRNGFGVRFGESFGEAS